MSPHRRRAAGVAAAIAIVIAIEVPGPPATSAAGPARKPGIRVHVRRLAPGVTLKKVVDRRRPRRTYVLTIDPTLGASVDVVLSNDLIPGLERTSSMARRSGAVAAVNGDFGFISGRPVHPFAADGELVQTSHNLGGTFALSSDGAMRIGRPVVKVTALEADTGEVWPVAAWNRERPGVGDLHGYTSVGGMLARPPRSACWATLTSSAEPVLGPDGTVRDHQVTGTGCTSSPPWVGENVVLSAEAGTDEAEFLRSLVAGEVITLAWSFGWPRVTDAIGGGPFLVRRGRVVLGPCSGGICGRNPRTAIGLTRDGRVLLVVVDGRIRGSVGMTLAELARFMRGLGAASALNLDGGGSSTMVARDSVVSRPANGFERGVSSAVVVRF
jgi:exopolysaccharide biosynthesis protein